MPKLKIEELNRIYQEAESVDKDAFSEFRSNILLVSGDHYKTKKTGYSNRVRSTKSSLEYQRLRLTKNHTHRVHRAYVNNILDHCPGTTVMPDNDSELQDQKAAELNLSVWRAEKEKSDIDEKVRQWVHSFVGIGEVCVKLFWDPNKGRHIGYAPLEEDGYPVIDEMGQPVPDEETPIFSGAFVWEEVYGFNLLRKVATGSIRDSECWIVRKMTDKKELLKKYEDDEDKKRFIRDASKEAFVIFDKDSAGYRKTKHEVLIREFYYKPCYEYPRGYFYITTQEGILEEGELPFGVWPLRWQGMDERPTAGRASSIHRVVRPYQAEINRAGSQQAQTQITIGDDKVLYQAGSKLQQGSLLPGVRGIAYQGQQPTILPGRDGSQYSPYIAEQIAELERAVMIQEDGAEKNGFQTTDNYALLFKSLKHKKRFAEYGEKFQKFLKELTYLYLELARRYLPDDEVIYSVGRKEQINIAEFRETSPLHYKIDIEEQDETIESKFGKQLSLNHFLQYAGASLDKNTLGKVIKNMPFANMEDTFSELTINEDNVRNDMLAIERGEQVDIDPEADAAFYIERFSHRIKQPDFKFLPEEVQMMFRQVKAQYQQLFAQQMAAEQAAKDGFIPVSGAMIATDMYVPNPKGPDKPAKRVRIPYQALDWLVKRLESQGATLDKLEDMNKGAVSELATMLLGQAQTGMAANPEQSAFQNAPESAVGVS